MCLSGGDRRQVWEEWGPGQAWKAREEEREVLKDLLSDVRPALLGAKILF